VSLAAARTAAAGFADGSLLLRLDTLRDEALLPHTIAAALRLSDQYTRSRLDVLVDQLRDRHLLLILDTCEHLLGACAALIGGEDNRYLLLETIREFGATASSGIVIPGPGAGADTGMKRFRGERPWGKRHDAEETADARDTIA
jgi:hypothetical protein